MASATPSQTSGSTASLSLTRSVTGTEARVEDKNDIVDEEAQLPGAGNDNDPVPVGIVCEHGVDIKCARWILVQIAGFCGDSRDHALRVGLRVHSRVLNFNPPTFIG
jgi:hypothetical protein